MEDSVIRIKLNNYQKREFLEIYKNSQDKKQVRSKLSLYGIPLTEMDIQAILDDCKNYLFIKDLFSIYQNGDYTDLFNSKEDIIKFVKDFIIQQYLETDLETLDEKFIIQDIVDRLSRVNFSDIDDDLIKSNMILFLQDKIKFNSDLLKEEQVNQLFKNKERYLSFLKSYVENLLQDDKHENSNEIRRKILVSDKEAEKLLMSDSFAIGIAQDYIYNSKRYKSSRTFIS